MKKERNSKNINQNLYRNLDDECGFRTNGTIDTRYYGIFKCGEKGERIKIDPIRYQKMQFKLNTEILEVINKRKTHYFYPAKQHRYDYSVNVVVDRLNECYIEWGKHFKKIKESIATDIVKKPEVSMIDNFNFISGISGPNSARMWADNENWKRMQEYKEECSELEHSMYGQFFHQFASKVETSTIKLLDLHKQPVEVFSRNKLYDFIKVLGAGKDVSVLEFDNYPIYDKTYSIWHFIKHNTMSTYEALKKEYPEILIDSPFSVGNLGIYYVKFSDELIKECIDGCIKFFKELCDKVFGENYEEAQWNFDDYFYKPVLENIEMIENPLGLTIYDEMD